MGYDLVATAYWGFFLCHFSDHNVPGAYSIYTSVLRPLQPWADDLVGGTADHRFYISSMFLRMESEVNVNPDHIETFQDYITFLKECGFHDIGMANEKTPPLYYWYNSIPLDDQKIPIEEAELALRIVLELCDDINALNTIGHRHLSTLFLFHREGLPEKRRGVIEFATLLLRYGADPCALNLNGISVLDVAVSVGSGSEFLEALELSGFDIEEVIKESFRRQSMFRNGHGKSTTVDEEDIAAPSREGLSRRRVVIQEGDED